VQSGAILLSGAIGNPCAILTFDRKDSGGLNFTCYDCKFSNEGDEVAPPTLATGPGSRSGMGDA
jgi:hypothetical protein